MYFENRLESPNLLYIQYANLDPVIQNSTEELRPVGYEKLEFCTFFTARHYASALYVVVVCVSVTCQYCIKMAECI